MKLYYENVSAINIAYNCTQQDGTNYVVVDIQFIEEKFDSGLIYTASVQWMDNGQISWLKGFKVEHSKLSQARWEWTVSNTPN